MFPAVRARFVLFCAVAIAAPALAGFQETQVFEQGQYGYHTFRIPAVVVSNAGTVLAFAEGRVNSPSDAGNIDLVLRRSFDDGQVWQGLQVVHNDGAQTIGNPVPVVDRTTGTVWLLFCRNNAEVFVTHSTNDGESWATPTNITNDVADPAWDFVATGPVHGFQMASGRLVVPSYRNPASSPSDVRSYMIYSDDHGATWTSGGYPNARCGESSALETEDGRIYLNARSWTGVNQRAVAFSSNGGLSWGPVAYQPSLPDPPCQGSVIRFTTKYEDHLNRVLFSNPPGLTRDQLSVRVSYDEGLTWNPGRMVSAHLTGYSDLTILPDGRVGVFYERGVSDYREAMWFATFDRDWLETVTDQVAWHFDEQGNGNASAAPGAIQDLGGSGQHATALGSRLPAYGPGAAEYGASSALTFTIGSDRVEWADDSGRALDFEANDSFTLEVVMRTSAHASGGALSSGGLIAKDWGPNLPSWWLRVQDGQPRFLIEDDAGISAAITGSVSVSDGQWHHVAAVRDKVLQELRVYVDHALVGVATDVTTGSLANHQNIRIGAFGNASREFDGDIDLVRISRGVLPAGAFVQPSVDEDVVAWWTFEEGRAGMAAAPLQGALRDASGRRHPATAGGTPAPTYVAGHAAYGQTTALQFTAADDRVVVEDRGGDAFDFAGDADFTLEALIRTTQQGEGGLVAKDQGGGLPSWWWRVEDGGRLQFAVCDGTQVSSVLSDAADAVSDGAWHHVAAVRDTFAGQLRLYVDAALVKTADDATTDALANDRDLVVGDLASVTSPFVGDIDFVKITRRALGPAAFVAPLPAPPIALADWRFDELPAGAYAAAALDKLADSSGSGRNLTALGVPRPLYVQGDGVREDASAVFLRNDEPDQLAYIDRGDVHFDFGPDDSFTLEATIRTTQADVGGLLAKDNPAGGGWSWQIEGGGTMRFAVSDGVYSASVRSAVLDNVNDGAWHHVAAVRDGASGELRLYKDYVQIDLGFDFTSGTLANDKDLLIGALHSSNAGFAGTIGRVRISAGALEPGDFLACSATPGDLDCDGACDAGDAEVLGTCLHGPDVNTPPAGCAPIDFDRSDLDEDGDVDLTDAAMLQAFAG